MAGRVGAWEGETERRWEGGNKGRKNGWENRNTGGMGG